MSLPLTFARRYLFAKKSTNAINVITGISVFGVTIGTAALILVMSVFNGFEDLVTDLLSHFNPDVKVLPVRGKVFAADSTKIARLRGLPGVAAVSETLEEIAFFEYRESQDFGILKGVDNYYDRVTKIDSVIVEGQYGYRENGRNLLLLGGGMRNKLVVDAGDRFTPLKVYMAKRDRVATLEKPFRERLAYPGGTFRFQQEYDSEYVLSSLEFARALLDYQNNELSQLEIRLAAGADLDATKVEIAAVMGPDFRVADRYEQEAAFLKLMNLEKWIGFAVLCLTLLLVAFNVVGSLWMIVLEKRKDIAILKSLGAYDTTVRNIFLGQGLLLCFLGMVVGFAVAILLYAAQKQFGLVPVPPGFAVDAYPISMRGWDFVWVTLAVSIIALLASLLPARRAAEIAPMVREE